jgi:hypothetical protein
MNSKKGAIEIQFNWLFVLIIGAVILTLFTSIIISQKNVSETSKNAFILKNMAAILSGSEVSTGTINVLEIPQTNIRFRCNTYSIGAVSKQLDVMNVFTPSNLEGNRIISMTLDFSMPYRVTNLVFLTNPNYRYIFIGNGDFANHLRSIMPNESYSDIEPSFADIVYEGEKKVRFVFLDDSINDNQQIPNTFSDYISLDDEEVTALKITGSVNSGNVDFFRKSGNKFILDGSSSYFGEESLIGAVFSDSQELYNCAMENVVEKINIVSSVYHGKTKKIREFYNSENGRCKSIISTAYTLQNLDLMIAATSDFSSLIPDGIVNTAEKIRNQNKKAQLESCAVIY